MALLKDEEVTIMTNEIRRHIETLKLHGAQVYGPDKQRHDLTIEFVENAISECIQSGFAAITYDLFLPGIDETMMIAAYPDGHVDSGSARNICYIIATRTCMQAFLQN